VIFEGFSRSELAILEAIRQRGQATRGEIGAAVGLGAAMTARLVARLQDAGLVCEGGRAAASGPGRQALLLELQPDIAYVAGVEVGNSHIHLLVADARATTRAYQVVPATVLAGQPQEQIVATLASLLGATMAMAGIPSTGLVALGVAVTGLVDSDRGVCLVRSNTPGWEDFALGAALAERLGCPVLVEETARAKALAELRRGRGRGHRHFLYVEAGTAIGAGIIIDGRPLRGVHGLAGELGHVIVDHDGPLCRCGNHGCLQASASALALEARARDLLRRGVYSSLAGAGEQPTLTEIAAAADQGDKMALQLLTEAGAQLGAAIGMTLNVLGLDLVVVGGRLAQCSTVVLEQAARSVQLHVLPIVPCRRTVVRGTLGGDAAALGMVLQALDGLFAADNLFAVPVERATGAYATAEVQVAGQDEPAALAAAPG
jgi:predicted NBD/HSP70 family sugar kinase